MQFKKRSAACVRETQAAFNLAEGLYCGQSGVDRQKADSKQDRQKVSAEKLSASRLPDTGNLSVGAAQADFSGFAFNRVRVGFQRVYLFLNR